MTCSFLVMSLASLTREVFHTLLTFGRVYEELVVIMLKTFDEFTSKAICSCAFPCGKIFITSSVSLLVISLFRFSGFFLECFDNCVFLGICLLHLGYLICWHVIVHSILL